MPVTITPKAEGISLPVARANDGRWLPGQSANPSGRRKSKPFLEALNRALEAKAEDGRAKLEHVAEAMVKAALDGEVPALKEIADRLDGKPTQEMEVTHDFGRSLLDVLRARYER